MVSIASLYPLDTAHYIRVALREGGMQYSANVYSTSTVHQSCIEREGGMQYSASTSTSEYSTVHQSCIERERGDASIMGLPYFIMPSSASMLSEEVTMMVIDDDVNDVDDDDDDVDEDDGDG